MIISGKVTRISDSNDHTFINIECDGVNIDLHFKSSDDPRIASLPFRGDVCIEINLAADGKPILRLA